MSLSLSRSIQFDLFVVTVFNSDNLLYTQRSEINIGWNVWRTGFEFLWSILTVALFAISTEFKARMTHTAEGAKHVDTSMGTPGMA